MSLESLDGGLSANTPIALVAATEETTHQDLAGQHCKDTNAISLFTSDTAPKGKILLKPSTPNWTMDQNPELHEQGVLEDLFPEIADVKYEPMPNESEKPENYMNSLWSFEGSDELFPVNPKEVEGIADTVDCSDLFEIELPVVQHQEAPTMDQLKTEVWSLETEVEGVSKDTSSTEFNMEVDSEYPEVEGSEPDLLQMVLNDTVQPDDPLFKEFVQVEDGDLSTLDLGAIIGPSTSSTQIEVKEEPREEGQPDHVTIVRRGRGRPRLPRPAYEPPRRPRGRPPTASTVALLDDLDFPSALSEEERKYRRVRELNNAASKRCRLNRKRKVQGMEDEEANLSSKNVELKRTVEELEGRVEKIKKAIHLMIKKKQKKTPAPAPVKVEEVSLPEEFDLDMLLD